MVEPCCNDCFWETKPENSDYSQGMQDGIKYARDKVTAMLGTKSFEDREHALVYATISADVARMLRG